METLIELEKSKMDVLREVADSNVLVSSLKAELIQLEKDKEMFFFLRENKLIERIKALLENSQGLLENTKQNYAQIHQFYQKIKEISETTKKHNAELLESITKETEKISESQNIKEEIKKLIEI